MEKRDIRRRVMASRHSTVVGNAFRRAFGLRQLWYWPLRVNVMQTHDCYEGLKTCHRNTASPLDGRHGKA